ncbi:exonuclease V-like [Amphiura filiformis]|uniref:exonuclease V-like n=1 Tax=Amphiura filiformis TaxID=82378 RepID=UPI003B224C06
MAVAGDDDFGSLDDSAILQAYEDYEQSQDEEVGGGGSVATTSSVGKSEDASGSAIKMKSGIKKIIIQHEEQGTGSSNNVKTGEQSTLANWIYEENNTIITESVRGVRSKYINTSDLQMQEWCEQQMIYNIGAKMGMIPQLITDEGAVVPVKEIQLTTPAMKAGTEVHKKKDLEVNSYVNVAVSTHGDSFALKLLNTIQHIKHLVMGASCIREVTIFSMPFDYGFMMMGIVDELRMNEHEELELVEVKTRSNRFKPLSKAQVRTHNLQAMVYKQIIDDLTSGVVDGNVVFEKMRLDPKHVLDEKVLEHARALDVAGNTLGDIMTTMLDQFRFLPRVSSMVVEYYPSDKDKAYKELLSSRRVDFDETWLKKRLETHFGFWRGEREVSGVDIEELWKCNMCQFVDACHWRKRKNDECVKKMNQKK